MTKRPDIQGIRGLAIAAVLAFHLDSTAFPAGFVGVDIFFVLSGYLMAVILSKECYLNWKVFREFYTRRFKRIVPLYAILIASLTILVPFFLLRRDVLKFCKDVVWAAAFSTNIEIVMEEKDYFTELFNSNVLTHTWSLGVEIQYYLIVPFIVLAERLIDRNYKCFPFTPILLLGSLAFQLVSTSEVAFNFLLSRVWQFLAGGLAHKLSSNTNELPREDPATSQKCTPYEPSLDANSKNDIMELEPFSKGPLSADLLSYALVVLVLCPWIIFPTALLRLMAVTMTGGLLFIGCHKDCQGFLLTNRALVYLGDISYVVYLVHWPAIILWKSTSDRPMELNAIFWCLLITFSISIIVHHTIEQYFIRFKHKSAAVVVAILYALLAICLCFDLPAKVNTIIEARRSSDIKVDIAEAIKFNEQASHNDYYKSNPFKECVDDPESRRMRGGFMPRKNFECVWKRQNVNGSVQILVLGNSIAQIATNILKSIIEHNFPQVALMRLVSMPACRPLEFIYDTCPEFHRKTPKLVQAMKPDITFILYDETERLNTPLLDARMDDATREFAAYLKPIVNASRFVILDEIYPRVPNTTEALGVLMQKRLIRNESLSDLKASFKSFKTKYANYFARLDLLRIPNLIRHNTSAAICAEEKGWCWWYNRRNLHAYFTDHTHFTTDGLELLRESYTKILKNVFQRLNL